MPLKLAEERGFIFNGRRATATRAQLDKLAIDRHNLSPHMDRRAAAWAFLGRARNDCLASLTQLRLGLATFAGELGSALSLLAVVEMVLADIRHHAEAEMVAGVVEDQKMILALGSAKTTPDRLDEPHAALGRLGVDDAADIQVDAGRQHADIADDPRLAGPEATEDASRSSREVVPSMYSAATPASRKRSATCCACGD